MDFAFGLVHFAPKKLFEEFKLHIDFQSNLKFLINSLVAPKTIFQTHLKVKSVKTRIKKVKRLYYLVSTVNTLFFFYKNVVFLAQAEYSYFSADFRLKIFLYYS